MQYTVAELHGAVTHFPVAMLIAAVAFEIGAPLFRKPEWRVVSFWLLVTAVAGAIPALATGWITGQQLYGRATDPPEIFTRHRLAAFITSGLAVSLLAWRVAKRDRLQGPAYWGTIVLLLVASAAVSYTGFLGGQMVMGGGDSPAVPVAVAPDAPLTNLAADLDDGLIGKGRLVYSEQGCSQCHRIGGRGGSVGPDLTNEGSRHADTPWQIKHLKDPTSTDVRSVMPSYGKLSNDKLTALATYLVSLR
jgi:uncharacterized membrane protein